MDLSREPRGQSWVGKPAEKPAIIYRQEQDWVFTNMELCTEIRHRVLAGQLSERNACLRLGDPRCEQELIIHLLVDT